MCTTVLLSIWYLYKPKKSGPTKIILSYFMQSVVQQQAHYWLSFLKIIQDHEFGMTRPSKQWNTIALIHYDVTMKILMFNARDHGRLSGTKQHKFQ